MTEAEIVSALSDIGSNVGSFFAAFYSLTFAYLTVAYMVGASLTRSQCVLVSVLSSLAGSLFGATAIGYSDTWVRLKARESSIIDEVWIFNNIQWINGLSVMTVGTMIAGLYFMLDVRRNSRNAI